MSFIRESNKSIAKIVGGGLVGLGALSTMSLMYDAPAVLHVPGGTFWDVVAAIGAAGIGIGIWREGSSMAGWLGAGVLALGLTSAGWDINQKQAGGMIAAIPAVVAAGAEAGANAGAQSAGAGEWKAIRLLTAEERAWCKQGDNVTSNAASRINCAPASDGKYYKWSRQ